MERRTRLNPHRIVPLLDRLTARMHWPAAEQTRRWLSLTLSAFRSMPGLLLLVLLAGVAVTSCDNRVTSVGSDEGSTNALDELSVSVEPELVEGWRGDTSSLKAVITDPDGKSVETVSITWTSGDTAVAKISHDGIVEFGIAGETVITATARLSSNDTQLSSSSSAKSKGGRPTSIRISPSSPVITEGDSTALDATVRDASGNVKNMDVKWSSSDESVISISASGVVVGRSKGVAFARAEAGPASDSIRVTVESSGVAEVVVTPRDVELAKGDTVQLDATVMDSSGSEIDRTVSWRSSDTTIAVVDDVGSVRTRQAGSVNVRAMAGGQADTAQISVASTTSIPAIPQSVSVVESSRGDTEVTYEGSWTASDGAESYSWSAGSNAGLWSQSGTELMTTVRFNAPRSESDDDSYFCVRAVNSAGVSESACESFVVPAASSSTSSPPPPSSGEIPQPDSDDRVLFDTRAGGSHDLQAMTTEAEVQAIFQDPTPYPDAGWGLTTDFDGLGTHAIRLEWPQTSNSDVSRLIIVDDLGSPAPSELYVQFKVWMGRTETGGGIGEIGAFDYTNPNESGASRKWIRVIGNTFNGDLAKHTFVFNGGNPHGARVGVNGNSDAWFFGSWSDGDLINRRLTWTFYLRAESSQGAADGVVRLWQDGNMIFERTGLTLNTDDFNRWQFPMIMRSPVQDQTEYIWDVLAWDPQ